MAKSTDNQQDDTPSPQAVLDRPERTTVPTGDAQRALPARQAQPQVRLDESKAVACYANFCRVTGTPEELIIDYGLNTQPMGSLQEPITATLRVIMNYYTAKRMLAALQMSVQRHEAAFGVLETDVQKRAASSVRRPPPAAT